jgi:hypothetical protein
MAKEGLSGLKFETPFALELGFAVNPVNLWFIMLNFRVRVRVLGFVEKWGFRRESQHGGKCVWVGQFYFSWGLYIYIYIWIKKFNCV